MKRLLPILCALALCHVVNAAWLPGWSYRHEIACDSTLIKGVEKTNFPVYVSLADSNLSVFRNAKPDGSDIRFTKAGGDTLLAFELVRYDPIAYRAEFWVLMPTFGDLQNVFYLYYGNASAQPESDPDTVWADYALVLHFDNDPAFGGPIDSSPNHLVVNRISSNVPSQWDSQHRLNDFKVGRSWIYHAGLTTSTRDLDVTALQWTLQAWVYQNEDGTNFIAQGDPDWFHVAASDDSDNDMQYKSDTSSTVNGPIDFRFHNGLATPEQWHFMAVQMVAAGDSIRVFLNDTMDTSATKVAGSLLARHGIGDANVFGLGSTQYVQSDCPDCMQGFIDELRVRAGTPPNANWLLTERNNTVDVGAFLTFAAEEANPCE